MRWKESKATQFLVHMVLRHLRHSIGSKEMELLIRKIPEALSVYQVC